jgi:hypothetical protein
MKNSKLKRTLYGGRVNKAIRVETTAILAAGAYK